MRSLICLVAALFATPALATGGGQVFVQSGHGHAVVQQRVFVQSHPVHVQRVFVQQAHPVQVQRVFVQSHPVVQQKVFVQSHPVQVQKVFVQSAHPQRVFVQRDRGQRQSIRTTTRTRTRIGGLFGR